MTSVSRRQLLNTAAWSVPVVAVAVAAPHASASATSSLSARSDGPSEYTPTQGTVYGLYVTNSSPHAIPSGALTARLKVEGVNYEWQGFSGQLWDYTPDAPQVEDLDFTYNAILQPGEESGVFLVIIKNPDRTQTPAPTAQMYFSVPGSTTVLPLVITF